MPSPDDAIPTARLLGWTGGADADWNDAANWLDLSTGTVAAAPPGDADDVVIPAAGSPGDGPVRLSGIGEARTVAVQGATVLNGSFRFAMLDVSARPADPAGPAYGLVLAPGTTVSVSGDASATAPLILADGTALAVGGTFAAGPVALSAAAELRAGELVAAGPITLDPAARFLVGAVAADPPAGTLCIAAGASLVMAGSVLSVPIRNDGAIELRSGVLSAAVAGNGVLHVVSGHADDGAGFDGLPAGPTLSGGQSLRFDGPNAALFVAVAPPDPDDPDPAPPIRVENFAPTDELAVPGTVSALSWTVASGHTLLTLSGRDGVHGSAFATTLDLLDDPADADDAAGLAAVLSAGALGFTERTVTIGAFDRGYSVLALSDAVPCFRPGTLIATPGGERPVETLRIGDPVLSAAGLVRPIRWIGRRAYPARVATLRPELWPVLILAGALGGGLPRRDLFLSPEHAVLLDGALIPAALLVNDVSVLREPVSGELRYLHLELERHDLLLAEGAPAESFADDRSRALFDNAAEYAALYPGRPATPPEWCAPRLEHGPRLLAARHRIDRLAGIGGRDPRPPLLGGVEECSPDRIRGWAWCPAHPAVPVLLDLRSDAPGLAPGPPLGRVLADRFRADLRHAGIGDGRHGFEFIPPPGLLRPGARPPRLHRALDGTALPAVQNGARDTGS